MASVSVQIIGLDKALSDIKSYVRRKHDRLVGAVAHAGNNIQSEARSLAPKDLGTLKNDINSVVKTKGSRLKGTIEGEILSAAPYSAFVEFGTRPHFPPPQALAGWASRHGMAGAEFQIAKNIALNGTPAQPFMDPAYRKEKDKFINNVAKVMSAP